MSHIALPPLILTHISPRYKVSNLPLIPSVVHQLVHYPGIDKVDFSSVQSMNSGAAYLPPELGDKLAKLVPDDAVFTVGQCFPRIHQYSMLLHFYLGYGMSEAVRILYSFKKHRLILSKSPKY